MWPACLRWILTTALVTSYTAAASMQACSAAYYRDCDSLFGSVFAHDDSVNDRTPGSKLQTNWATSQARPSTL